MKPLSGVLPLLLLSLAACRDTGPISTRALPQAFHLAGAAAGGTPAGDSAFCSLDLVFNLLGETHRSPVLVEYAGHFGGDVDRSVLAPDGSGFGFSALVDGAVTIRLIAPDSIELYIPANDSAEGRLWRNLALLVGHSTASDPGRGHWLCAPFDIYQGGYVDTTLIVPGVWWITVP